MRSKRWGDWRLSNGRLGAACCKEPTVLGELKAVPMAKEWRNEHRLTVRGQRTWTPRCRKP